MIFSINNFGAIPNDDIDDTDAFRKILERAASLSPMPITIELNSGRYILSPANEGFSEGHLTFNNLQNVTIIGNGAVTELVMTSSRASGILVSHSSNITLKDFSIDFQPLPYTQGTIVGVDTVNRTFLIEIDDNFSSPLSDNLVTATYRKTRAYLFRPDNNRITYRFFDQYPIKLENKKERKLEKVSDKRFIFHSANVVNNDFIGYKVVVVGRSKLDGIKLVNSSDINIFGVDVYSSPSTAFKIMRSEGKTVIQNSRVIPKPGTNRLLSSNADGLHAKFNRAPIHLKYSRFEALGDDGVNIGGAYLSIIDQLDATTLLIEPHKSLHPGDTITITDALSGSVLSKAIIDDIDRVTLNDSSVALKVKVKSAVETNSTLNLGAGEREVNLATSLDSVGLNSIILGNLFTNIRGRGIMLHSDYSIVKANTFQEFRGPGIVIGPDLAWRESSTGNHSVIVDNIFDDIYWNNIIINGGKDYFGKPSTRNIVIERNTFRYYGRPNPIQGRGQVGPILFLRNLSNIKVRENYFGKPFVSSYSGPLVILEMARKIEFINNTYAVKRNNWLELRSNVDLESLVIK